eukprot:CAMPEP_0202096618 /NCGR_PEP_ID=MMETSP0965-20130614/730_1 /ASSEMBLY_ACC=CAM_ASM_000507 /TAXON_ID=4773 /ORGANISM="Schizochytrium aggregatum, Strain ATCC28209" /LENGTH=114 /DNA_ID=CAMNT_0048664965 /DNA_START=57 /DNA_END=398 /DNA_ORIENTATION=+
MKLSVKPVKGAQFEIEAEPSSTVPEAKEKIAASQGWAASALKLIYKGKILADDKTLGDYGVDGSGFLVVMVQKVKAAAPASSAPAAPAAAATAPAAAPASTAEAAPATPQPSAQ